MIPHLLEERAVELDQFAREPVLLAAFDFDGTLSPIAPTPASARIEPAASAALERLADLSTGLAIAIVSGRRVADLRRLVPPVDFLVGLHGLEIQAGGAPPVRRLDTAASDRALARLRADLAPALSAGGRLEDKEHALALHVRGLDAERARRATEAFVAAVERARAAGAPLELLRGKAVVEARPLGAGKHGAIAAILDQLGVERLLFTGDDQTDEEVFEAFPRALTVAVMDPPRVTSARTYLRSPAEVASMIESLVECRRRLA